MFWRRCRSTICLSMVVLSLNSCCVVGISLLRSLRVSAGRCQARENHVSAPMVQVLNMRSFVQRARGQSPSEIQPALGVAGGSKAWSVMEPRPPVSHVCLQPAGPNSKITFQPLASCLKLSTAGMQMRAGLSRLASLTLHGVRFLDRHDLQIWI